MEILEKLAKTLAERQLHPIKTGKMPVPLATGQGFGKSRRKKSKKNI
jgi:hypothetical protein